MSKCYLLDMMMTTKFVEIDNLLYNFIQYLFHIVVVFIPIITFTFELTCNANQETS